MKWRDRRDDWQLKFALFPVSIDGSWHWLVWYWRRFCGDCFQVSLDAPRCDFCGGGPVFCRHCMDRAAKGRK